MSWMPVTVLVSSQPVVPLLSLMPVVLSQVMDVALVSPEPPSLKRTWMSAVGVSVNEVVSPTYGLSLHFALLSMVTEWPEESSTTNPVGGDVSVTV